MGVRLSVSNRWPGKQVRDLDCMRPLEALPGQGNANAAVRRDLGNRFWRLLTAVPPAAEELAPTVSLVDDRDGVDPLQM